MGETFGARVYQARLALQAALGREVTQAEVGKAVGVTGQAVGLWETGKSEPKLAVIIRLAQTLQSNPAWLAFGMVTVKEKAPADVQAEADENARRLQNGNPNLVMRPSPNALPASALVSHSEREAERERRQRQAAQGGGRGHRGARDPSTPASKPRRRPRPRG